MKLPFPVIGQSIDRNVYALRSTLFHVFEKLSIPHYVAGGAWEYLQARYTEPHRHYHTLGHLVDMFNAAAELGEELTRAEVLAVLYHDIIYEVGAKDNEEQSAQVLEGFRHVLADASRNNNPEDMHVYVQYARSIDTAAQIIRDTARYLDEELPTWSVHSLLVMDLDLSSFAKPYELFKMTNELVRAEVGIDHGTHAQFLNNFLQRGEIYRTDAARDAWGAAAWDNIARYVQEAKDD